MSDAQVKGDLSVGVQITQILRKMGIPANINGYHYLRSAIGLVYDRACRESMTQVIYPELAEMYSTTPAAVERSMRHALKIACARGNSDVLVEYFAYTIIHKKKCPSNGEFVSVIADSLLAENGMSPSVSRPRKKIK